MDKQKRKIMINDYKQRKIVGGVYAITNTPNGKMLLQTTSDIQGSQNRFEFSQMTGGCVSMQLQEDWKAYGADAFTFEILGQLEKKDTQTAEDFADDLKTLYDIILQDIDPSRLYNRT